MMITTPTAALIIEPSAIAGCLRDVLFFVLNVPSNLDLKIPNPLLQAVDALSQRNLSPPEVTRGLRRPPIQLSQTCGVGKGSARVTCASSGGLPPGGIPLLESFRPPRCETASALDQFGTGLGVWRSGLGAR